jgi:hypothetical protein
MHRYFTFNSVVIPLHTFLRSGIVEVGPCLSTSKLVPIVGNRTVPGALEISISQSVASESLHHLQFTSFVSIMPSPAKEDPKAITQNRYKQQNSLLNSVEKKKDSSRKGH